MTMKHVEVLNADEAVTLYETLRSGRGLHLPDALVEIVGSSSPRSENVPAGDTVPVDRAGALMLLGASRRISGHGVLVPGDVLVLDQVGSVVIEESEDENDASILLAWPPTAQ